VATPASDRYSLAVVGYELLHGRRPSGEPLDGIFRRALAADRAARFPSATAFVDALAAPRAAPAATTPAAPPRPPVGTTAILRRHRATARAVRLAKRSAATAIAGAVAAFLVLAFGYVRADAPASVTCTLSPSDHDANLVVSGVGANTYCARRARDLAWNVRPGFSLRSPDLREHPSLVCAAHVRGLRVAVYDDGRRRIGRDVCGTYRRDELASSGA
jgi:hypothetical protein